jgi:hypothetical protein
MKGTRMPPSQAVKYWPFHGPAQPSQSLMNWGLLSLAKITIVSSRPANAGFGSVGRCGCVSVA